MSIDKTLEDRAKDYGDFLSRSEVTQGIKRAIHRAPKYHLLRADMQEALDQIACKVGRILNGDPAKADNWHDIQGYARLVEERLPEAVTDADYPNCGAGGPCNYPLCKCPIDKGPNDKCVRGKA